MTREELQDIINSHERWLNGGDGKCADLRDADLSFTDLSDTNLSNAVLYGANLHSADLSNADLRHADLGFTDLSNAKLRGANLSNANLQRAKLNNISLSRVDMTNVNLRGAHLTTVNLSDANLLNVDLSDAEMHGVDLRGADLRGANLDNANLNYVNLSRANLYYSNLSNADLSELVYNEGTAFYALQCPEEGSFIGYKKAHDYIVKLEILANAKRSSATSRKCRCSAAKVLSITAVDGSEEVKEIASDRDSNFIYRVGEIVRVDNFDEDRWNECSTGIHFFITRREAEQYSA